MNTLKKNVSKEEIDFYLEDLKSRFPKNRENYYLSYSGGRDSHFLYWFIKEYLKDEQIEIVSVNTYMEHHEILKRMRNNADVILIPEIKPFEIKEKYGSPCFSKIQDDFIERYQKGCRTESLMKHINGYVFEGKDKKTYKTLFKLNNKARDLLLSGKLHKVSPKCCTHLKKKPLKRYEKETGRHAILGVRSVEGNLRKSQYKSCFSKDGTFHPIYDLTNEMLEAIEHEYKIEVPEIYDHILRTDCMGCPYGSWKHETQKELKLISKQQRNFVCELFKESYQVLGIEIEEGDTNGN